MTPLQVLAEVALLDPDQQEIVGRWLARGDGIAVYRNEDLGHPEIGHLQFLSFGSHEAQLETDTPPERLPDIGSRINWRYRLAGTYRRKVQRVQDDFDDFSSPGREVAA
jgi:hypothetical protein